MWFPKRLRLLPALALIAATSVAMGDEPKGSSPPSTEATDTVTVIATADRVPSCNDSSAERARELADKAFQDGAYRRAADCYRVAGKPDLADLAMVRAVSAASADTSRKLAANSAAVKAQVRQLATAFRSR